MSINSISFTSAPGVKIYNDSNNIVINPDNINYIQENTPGKPRLHLNNGASPYFDTRADISAEECAKRLLDAQEESKKTGKIIDLAA